MAGREEFRKLAEQLAELEAQILTGRAASNQQWNPMWEIQGQKKAQTTLAVCLAVAAIAAVLLKLMGDGGIKTMILGVILLAALLKAYLEWGVYKKQNAKLKQARQGFRAATDLEGRRKELIGKLDVMRRADPGLNKKYWWDAGISPNGFASVELPGTTLSSDWEYVVAQQVTLTEREDGLYCEDFVDHGVGVLSSEVEELVQSGNAAVLYRDEAVMSRPHEMFLCKYLYALDCQPIEEISTSTTRTRVDKEAEMRAYQDRLDAREVLWNAATGDGLLTNREAALYGKRSVSEFQREELYRGLAESDRQSKINAMPDYEEETQYRKVFRNLYVDEFVTCAMIFLSLEEQTAGKVAMVILPQVEVPSLTITMRAESAEHPSCGYLEHYMGQDALVMGKHNFRPSIRMAADQLFGGEWGKVMGLRKLDILAEKPSGLSDAEWCYLIWKNQVTG